MAAQCSPSRTRTCLDSTDRILSRRSCGWWTREPSSFPSRRKAADNLEEDIEYACRLPAGYPSQKFGRLRFVPKRGLSAELLAPVRARAFLVLLTAIWLAVAPAARAEH